MKHLARKGLTVILLLLQVLFWVPARAGDMFEVDRFIEPPVCSDCHSDIHGQWENSTHNLSHRDPLYNAVAKYFLKGLTEAGFVLKEGDTPIVPVMLFNAKLSQDVSKDLYEEGIYAIGFFFPVVPKGQARIRTQISAGHEIHHLDKALEAFIKVGKKYDILGKSKQEIIEMYGM